MTTHKTVTYKYRFAQPQACIDGLLEALRLAVNTLTACDGPSKAERGIAIDKARAAIAKATEGR